MKIDIWSDFVCPFCYIGKRRLENALSKFENKDEIELIFHSFELDPYAKKKYEENIHELIANKYGIPLAQAQASNEALVNQAKELGLNYNFEDIIPTNTFDAHRLSHYAKTEGKMNELSERILKAYFVDSLDISNHEVLVNLAREVGLDANRALKVLKTNEYEIDVRKDQEKASKLRITGVPYFVFNSKYSVSGAQPSELFLEVLHKVKNDALTSPLIGFLAKDAPDEEDTNGFCSDGKC